MGVMAENGADPEFVLATGDVHHFEGVRSVNDPLWMTNYELIYSHPELMIDWFPLLGNHEYRGNTQAVQDYSNVSRRWTMPARYYTKTFADKDMTIRVVWIDTAPLIDKYRNEKETYPDACKQDYQQQLAWIDSVLTSAKEDWIIVAGHHPFMPKLPKTRVNVWICKHVSTRYSASTKWICTSAGISTTSSTSAYRAAISIISPIPPVHSAARSNPLKALCFAALHPASPLYLPIKKLWNCA